MPLFHSLPETQAALALFVFLATFVYEDGATLLAATLSASGGLDPRIGLLTTFLGIWVGDMGLYGLGSSFGRRTAQSRWLQKYLRPESLAKAERWFLKHGSFPLLITALVLFAPWLLGKTVGGVFKRFRARRSPQTCEACNAVGLCAL